jgi:hypothetical protein
MSETSTSDVGQTFLSVLSPGVSHNNQIKTEDFPFLISNFSFSIASNSNHRLENGLVRLARRAQVPYLNSVPRNSSPMKNEKWKICSV